MSPVDDAQASEFIRAWHFFNWLLVLACPRIFHRMARKPSREHLLKLVDDSLPYAHSERQRRIYRHGLLFKVDRERRERLATRLRELLMQWSPPELSPEITESARALLDTEGHDPPQGGWGNVPDPDLPPEDFLLWPEGTPAIVNGFRGLPASEEQRFPAGLPVRAPSADVEAASRGSVFERIAGEIYVEPRPALRQVMAASALGGLLERLFHVGEGGPGGWVILDKPEILVGDDVLIPDLAGWRAERAPEPTDEPATRITPDWICEILGPSKSIPARVAKMHAYGHAGMHHAWLLDPFERSLEVLQLGDDRRWQLIEGFAAFLGHTRVRTIPFEVIEIDLARLWPESA